MPDPVSFLGLPLHPVTVEQAVSLVEGAVSGGGRLNHVALNAAKVATARRVPALARAIRAAGLVTADGQGVVWGARLLGLGVPERVTGIDLMDRLVALAAERGFRTYFLGARPEVVEATVAHYRRAHPDLAVAGARDGYFGEGEEASVARTVRDAGADLLFCALPTPRKEVFLDRWFAETGARFAMGVGGAFDVVAGVRRRAPPWLQEAGLEWFYRFAQEPVRLGRRTFVDQGTYLLLLASALLPRRGPRP